MPSLILASRSVISLAHILQWPGIQWKTVGPNQIGSDRGPDCPHSIQGKEVRGRVQEGEGGLGVSKDSQRNEWANGVMLEAPSKSMTKDCDLCDEAG